MIHVLEAPGDYFDQANILIESIPPLSQFRQSSQNVYYRGGA